MPLGERRFSGSCKGVDVGRDWEETLRRWSGPASASEDEKRDRAERLVRAAIAASNRVPATVRVFAKGSYANNTNVRLDSDVDVAVTWTETYFYDQLFQASGLSPAQLGVVPAQRSVNTRQFKDDVESALVDAFGRSAVVRHNRCLTVRETTARLEADVVPSFNYRRYDSPSVYHEGVCLFADSDRTRTVNWPDQQKANGVQKNTRTGTRFKSMVRALKRLEDEMGASWSTPLVRSYLVECLVYTVPDPSFGSPRYVEDMRRVFAWCINGTKDDASCQQWVEVNELKYLFRGGRRWTRAEANAFVVNAWRYMDQT